MIQTELTREKYRLPEVFDSQKTPYLPKDKPTEGVLEIYFETLFETEPIPPGSKEVKPILTPEDSRRQALEISVSKLSAIEMNAKEHVEEYLRYQCRRQFKGSTVAVSLDLCFVEKITSN